MTMTVMSAKIEDMKSLPWPLAAVAMTAMVVILVLALNDKDVSATANIILLVLMALGIAELREIKSNTNGTNNRLMDNNERLQDRNDRLVDRVAPPPQDPGQQP